MVRTAAQSIHELRGVGNLLHRALRLPVEHHVNNNSRATRAEQQESIQTRAIGLGGYGVGSLFLDHRCCSGKHGQQIACRLHLRTELGWSETARRNAEPEPEPEQQPEPEPEPEPEQQPEPEPEQGMWSVPTRQRTLSGRISSAARRHSTAARPSQSDASPLAQSAAHRPPNPDNNKPSAHSLASFHQTEGGIRVTGGSAGSSSFIAAQPPPSSSCCARVQISSSIASSVPDVSSSLTLRATNGNDQRSRSRSRSRSRAWVGTDQRLRMALAVRFVMNLAALAPQFPMPNCRTCLTRWPSSAALQPRAST